MIFMISVVTVFEETGILYSTCTISGQSTEGLFYKTVEQFLHFVNELNSIKQVHICFVKV